MCCSISEKLYLKLDDCSLVIIEVAIIWRRENGDNCWKFFSPRPFVHLETFCLCLVCADDRYYFVSLEKSLSEFAAEKVRASTNFIGFDEVITVSVFIIDRVCPHQITEKSILRNFSISVDLLDVIELSDESGTVLSS